MQKWGYGSIILKIILWAHFTITHAVLRGSADFFRRKKNIFWDTLMVILPLGPIGQISINLVISEVFIAAENDTIDQYSLLTLSNDS